MYTKIATRQTADCQTACELQTAVIFAHGFAAGVDRAPVCCQLNCPVCQRQIGVVYEPVLCKRPGWLARVEEPMGSITSCNAQPYGQCQQCRSTGHNKNGTHNTDDPRRPRSQGRAYRAATQLIGRSYGARGTHCGRSREPHYIFSGP